MAYILMHFPHLSETFIAQEIDAIRSQNVDVHIVSLLKPGANPVNPLSQRLTRKVWYAPGLASWHLWKAQFYYCFHSPHRYFAMMFKLLCQPIRSQLLRTLTKRLIIFLKSAAVAFHLKNMKIELIHSHFAWLSGAAAWIAARFLTLPFTITMHAYDIYSRKNDLLSLICLEADHVVTISEYNRRNLVTLGVKVSEPVTVIHCGVDMHQFQLRKKATNTSSDGHLRILSVGNMVKKKGHTYLIDACHLLKQTGCKFHCTIIGGGPEEMNLRLKVQRLGIQEQMTLLGPLTLPEIVEAYQQHDLFVLSCVIDCDGDRDGIPVVLMEAGAMGMPIISTNISGIPEVIHHDYTGWLVPPADSAALAEAIRYLAQNSDKRTVLGRNARKLVKAEFNIYTNASLMASFYRSVIHSNEKMIHV